MNPALRNTAIVLGIAALAMLWQHGFGASALVIQRVIGAAFVVLIAFAVYRYFSHNRLAWYAIPPVQRYVFVALLVGAVALLLVGDALIGRWVGPFGQLLLIAAMVVGMVWIVRESRRL